MSGFYNQQGQVQDLPLAVTMYREAADANMSLQGYLNAKYPTDASKYGTTFEQLCASEGISIKANREFGIRPSTMHEVINGRPEISGATNVKDAVPASRILFPAVFMQAIEDKLIPNLDMTANAFDQLVGIDENISGDRYEQPVINFDKPSAARSMGISQLAQPASMLTITASDKSYRIPTFALGMEISDQALKISTLDIVALSLARQAAIQRNERAENYILALWNGDVDNGEGTLSAAGVVDNSSTFDAAATGGAITQRAWMKFLMKNGKKRTITHLVTDIDTAMKIEGRSGKPVITTDDPNSPRIDTTFTLMNPTWAKNPKIFLTDNPAWAANTIMAIDQKWAVRRVRNLSAEYSGIENFVLRRSTAMRFDFAEHVNRMYVDAFAGMVLA